jgi:uncharacterized protein (TIGR00661 family)
MKKINCAVFISDVGFGHMVRQRQVIQELLRVFKNISITVYNKNNLKILKKSFQNKIKYRENFNNIYLYKTKNGLLDLRRTKKEVHNWESNAKKFLKNKYYELSKYDFFISDLVPEISYFAFIKGKPCFSICHYTWDWFFDKIFKKNRNTLLMKEYTNLSSKIYFPPFTHKAILRDTKKFKLVNFVSNKLLKSNFLKNKKKKTILIMNNGTKTLSLKIAKIIPILNELRNYNFYISTSKLQKKLLQKVKMSKNIFLINNSLRSMYNFIKNADLIIARGGYNTITECLVYRKPSILAEEKNNPEIMENLSNIKKKNLAAIIKDHEWRPKTFKKMIDRFFKYRINFIISNLKKFRIKNNGAQDIVKDIKKELKLKKIL